MLDGCQAVSGIDHPQTSSGIHLITVVPDGDGVVSVIVPAGTLTDLAGNLNAASNLVVRNVDLTAPAPTLRFSGPNPAGQSSFQIEVDFGEPVSGFQASDLLLTSGTAELINGNNDTVFLVQISGMEQGSQSIALPTGVATVLATCSSPS